MSFQVCGSRKSRLFSSLRYDDGLRAVRREIQVVGVGDGNRSAGQSGARIDGRERIAEVAVDVQGPQVVRWDNMLRPFGHRE